MPGVAVIQHRAKRVDRTPLGVTLFHLVMIFLVCSFAGLLGEVVVSFFRDGRWESRAGFVIGPFSPIYGLGAVLMTLALNPIRDRHLPTQFVVSGVTGAALEYFGGWFFETRYGIVAWSYADQPFNLHGHTCLMMAIVWGFIGIVWANALLPHVMKWLERHVPESSRRPLTALCLAFILADSALTIACLDSWFWRSAGYPISNPLQQFCATYFDDDFMRARFETMSMWTSLANR